jgi:hypothetical protein
VSLAKTRGIEKTNAQQNKNTEPQMIAALILPLNRHEPKKKIPEVLLFNWFVRKKQRNGKKRGPQTNQKMKRTRILLFAIFAKDLPGLQKQFFSLTSGQQFKGIFNSQCCTLFR